MTKQVKNVLLLLLVAVTVLTFFWLAEFLGSGERAQSEKPLVICQPQNAPPEQQKCNWTAHIHATIRLFSGGKEIPVKFEEGVLEGQHTHSEPNKLHWHGLTPVDPKNKEVTDWSALQVKKIVTDFKPSQQGALKFIVNDKEVDPSYIWKNGDIIEIHYE
ncbi:MAG: hypothetical protein WAP74_04750 [Patescibacteria group bacterium]